jgi:LemA protein
MKFPFKLGPTGKIVVVIALIAILVFTVWLVAAYNGLVGKQVAVQAQWAQVENQMQRKFDLIPTLVNISDDYAEFETSLLTNLTLLRSQWQNATRIPDQMNISNLASLTLASWVSVYEAYPNLQTIQVVEDLFFEVTGTENRIAYERLRYNDRVQTYNTSIRVFPDSLVAGMFGFQAEPFFDPIPGGP